MRSGAGRVALLIAVTFSAYALAPASGFIWDDHTVIEQGRLIGSLRNVPRLFAHNTMYNSDGGVWGSARAVDTYRPLTMTTFFVERALFGLRPVGYHIDSVLLHLANVLLLLAVAQRLGLSDGAATAAALLFAVHPSPTEAVHWVNGRSDPLATFFFLAALALWQGGARSARRAITVAVLFLLATLSKETAFLLLPSLLLMPRAGGSLRARAIALAPWGLGALLGFACRMVALERAALGGGGQLAPALARLPAILGDGLVSLALPSVQVQPSLFEAYREVPIGRSVAAAVGLGALGLFAAWRLLRGRPLPAIWLCAFVATFAPVAIIATLDGWSGWGRYLYPSMPLFAIALVSELRDGLLTHARPSLLRVSRFAFGAAIALLSLETLAAGRIFHDDCAMAEAQVADHPRVSIGYSNLGMCALNAGEHERGLALLDQALERAPDNLVNRSRRAEALMRLGRMPEAFAAAREALRIDPTDGNARYIHALDLLGRGRQADAARLLIGVLRLEPEQRGIWTLMEREIRAGGPECPFALAARASAADPLNAPIATRLRALNP
ncbi:MAG: tetratricopeptide repeat protein [Myxococcales bacterium]|nr:tetratricopeptide repeat protein [Myxococcales bacterium]